MSELARDVTLAIKLGCEHLSLYTLTIHEIMGNFIGIDGENAKFVEFSEDVALTAANAACQPNLQHGEIVADHLPADN